MSSKKFQMNREDWVKVLKVLGWSAASALVAGLIAVVASPDLKLPPEVIALVPLVNAFLYGVNKWLSDHNP